MYEVYFEALLKTKIMSKFSENYLGESNFKLIEFTQ